jgi:hypothetical protein
VIDDGVAGDFEQGLMRGRMVRLIFFTSVVTHSIGSTEYTYLGHIERQWTETSTSRRASNLLIWSVCVQSRLNGTLRHLPRSRPWWRTDWDLPALVLEA